MYQDREKYIIQALVRDKQISVRALAKEMYASEQSIRRDLQRLEKDGLIKRVHGGAILEESDASKIKIPFLMRELEHSDEKKIMAQKAISLVKDNDVVFLDSSSSAYHIIPFLAAKDNITVITNGIKALCRAGEYNINAYSTGGHFLPSCHSLVGEEAYSVIESFHADVFFFSCKALSLDGMLTDFSIEEDLIRRKMLENAKRKVLLCNSQKIGPKYMHVVCRARDLDCIISERPLPEELREYECSDGI